MDGSWKGGHDRLRDIEQTLDVGGALLGSEGLDSGVDFGGEDGSSAGTEEHKIIRGREADGELPFLRNQSSSF